MFPSDAVVQALGTTRDASGRVSVADPATLNQRAGAFIELAENEADAYISTQYLLPLRSVPPVLKPFIADLARKWIYSEKANEVVVTRHQAAISFLNKIARGDVLLGVPQQDANVATTSGLPLVSTRNAHESACSRALSDWSGSFRNGRFL